MDSIGGFKRFEYSDEVYYKRDDDSLVYQITIFGKEKTLSYSSSGINSEDDQEVIINELLVIR